MNKRFVSDETPNHPGLALAALLNRCEFSVEKASEITGIPEFDLHQITNCRRGITALEAVRFAFTLREFSAAYWMEVQTKYDLHVAESEYLIEFAAKQYDHWDAALFAEYPEEAEKTRIAKHEYAKICAKRSLQKVVLGI